MKLKPSETEFALSVPDHCDVCGFPIQGRYVDGKTVFGPWANMCLVSCFRDKGIGLGVGKGQQFELQPSGKWAKMVPATEAKRSVKPPTERTMTKWMMHGVAKSTDGCTVEPDGHCPHGKPSWLLEKGLL